MTDPSVSPPLLDAVRRGVRTVLEQTPEFRRATPDARRRLAERMVRVGAFGAAALEEHHTQGRKVAQSALASAQEISRPDTVDRATRAVEGLKAAIDFPTYVQSLISGVFQAITRSNLDQLESIADMLDHVASASAEDGDASEGADVAARRWAAARVPGVRLSDGQLSLADEVDLDRGRLRDLLGASQSEVDGVDTGNLEESLLPLVRRKLARDRTQLLATMVQMGLQRIVVDEGQLTAQMEMRVDARSVEQQLERDRSELGVNAAASANFGVGAWGASASVSTSFSKVHAEDRQRTDDLGMRAQLYSHVQLAFRTEQIPLDRMADQRARVRIAERARVPDLSTSGTTMGSLPTMPTGELTMQRPPASAPTAPMPGATGTGRNTAPPIGPSGPSAGRTGTTSPR